MYQIADLRDHPELAALNEQLTFHSRAEKADQDRMKKEVEELMQKYKAQHKEIWDKVEDYIIENNLVREGYVRNEEHISFDKKEKVLFHDGKIEEQVCDNPLHELFRRLLT